MRRWKRDALLRYHGPTPKIIVLGVAAGLIPPMIRLLEMVVNRTFVVFGSSRVVAWSVPFYISLLVVAAIFAAAVIERVTRSDARAIRYAVRRRLCAYELGNPLHLQDGEAEPRVTVTRTARGFRVRVVCPSAKFEAVSDLGSVISDALSQKYQDYAVVSKEEDVARRYVDYYIEDVVADYQRQSVYSSIDDVPACTDGRLCIRDDVCIDYSKVLNSSALIVGGTRSGKTTGVISTFLLPILLAGPDEHGSAVVIVDPKSAELSQCAHVLSPGIRGEAEHILDAVSAFNEARINRQKYINDLGRKRGKVVKWYEADMHPSVLFLDEWVALQDLFPRKPTKDQPDYSQAEFLSLVRQIATQGASAGCFLVISTAQASVGAAGLDTIISNACGIRVLFRPRRDEALFLWPSSQLEELAEWRFGPGDAWFTAEDGEHNRVSFVRFPRLDDAFDEYSALSDLMAAYYSD